MVEQREIFVLNYPVEDVEISVATHVQSEAAPKHDASFDENQNAKITRSKNLRIILEKKEMTPKKVKFRSKRTTQNSIPGCKSTSLKRKRGQLQKKVKVSDSKTIKLNGFRNLFFKKIENRSLSQKTLDSRLTNNVETINNDNRISIANNDVIKDENVGNEVIPTTPVTNTGLGAFREPDEVAVKYESVEQIHTEFKYESLSETEENIRKRKQALSSDSKENNSLRDPKKLQKIKSQTTLNSFFNAMDSPLKYKFSRYNIFKCEHCLYVGNCKANLDRHSLIHMKPDDILWYRCMDCEYKSKYEHQLKSHTLIHKNPDDILYFQCPHCDQKCSRKHNLTNHIKSIHSNRTNTFKCANCDYSTFSKDRLVAHVKKHSTEVFTCDKCKFVTKRKEYLDSHFKLKHSEVNKPHPCDTCSYKGKTRRELDRHYDRMHNKDKQHEFKCNHCDFTSIYKKNLEFHLLHMHQNSEGFQKFICGHCFKEFAYKNGLKTHIVRIHLKLTDDDWHKCQECKYKCKDVNTLKRHIKRNHGAPRLHCKQCSFATNRQKSMIAHMKTHEVDADILKCPECPYRIIQAVSFVYHMKVLHGKPIRTKDIHKYYLKED